MTPIARDSKWKLLDAAVRVIRTRGYTATTVDDICHAAGVSKGSFFHHFESKQALALAAVEHWNTVTGALFAQAPYHRIADPRERVLGYIDCRADLLQGSPPEFTCLLGTMVQEAFDTHPAIREACRNGIEQHARTLVEAFAQARSLYAPDADWSAEGLALYTQAVIQGAFILAKAQGSAGIAAQCIAHLRRHVELLLNR